jgi:hypothetical protein
MVAEAKSVVMVARSADLRLQVITDLLRTRWKGSSQAGSGWTPWQPFPADGLPADEPGAWAPLAAAQLPSAAENRPGTGRLQVWLGGGSALYSTIKSSEVPDAPWEPWAAFTLPPPFTYQGGASVVELTVVALRDGRLQLWMNLVSQISFGQVGLWSTVKLGPDWQSGWSKWELFELPGLTDPSNLWNVVAAPLATGQTQLWGLSQTERDDVDVPYAPTVYTAIRQAATGNPSDPLSEWGPWSYFETGKPVVPPAQGLLAATDGTRRTYLWINAGDYYLVYGDEQPGAYQNNWMYTFNGGAADPSSWNPLLDFATPPSQGQAGGTFMSAATLPDGRLQLFYLTTPEPPGEPVIWTRWQEPGQNPSVWTQWYSFQ